MKELRVKPHEAYLSKGRTLLVMLSIWTICLLYCVYPTCQVIVHPVLKMCLEKWPSHQHRFIFSSSLTFFFYLMPLFVICVCYASMAKVLWNAGMDISRNRSGAARRKSRRKIARMVLILVVCFALCWLPYHTRVMLEMAGATRKTSFHLHFGFLARAFAYLNSCLNPLLYSFLGENFRSQMRDVFFCVHRMSFMKPPNTGITDLHEMEGSRRGGNNSAETQTTYESHAKVITSNAL
ncbi:Somatostatin receptor type 5 [Holothuria leucospilota]|uniref:Somatostatin receptor type 5 n=1 Tax=Holothuria leucospilota TaxID=206669 RepID=A0A9Q1C2B5_HOLLE|nr:Somatostatin receptor type 5 [Holothuria leucospilota]